MSMSLCKETKSYPEHLFGPITLRFQERQAGYRDRLTQSRYPILTAAVVGDDTYLYGQPTTMSRAHLTMAKAVAQALGQPEENICDVTRILPGRDYLKILNTTRTGQKVARSPLLCQGYQLATPFVRRMIPLNGTFDATCGFMLDGYDINVLRIRSEPFITLHYGVGNAMVAELERRGINNVPVVHFITDPYVHDEYLRYKNHNNVYYFTFDKTTKAELVKNGVPETRVVTVGYPIANELDTKHNNQWYGENYKYQAGKKLRVAVLTGGIGGNQKEILEVANGLDYVNQQGVFYCGTNPDLAAKLATTLVKKGLNPRLVTTKQGIDNFSVNADDQAIIVLGERLDDLTAISYKILNWAQIVCTKPSGDFGIESLLANKLVVAFANWGKHEANIRKIISSSLALVNVPDLNYIGDALHKKYQSNEFSIQAQKVFASLKMLPPFVGDNSSAGWKDNLKEALLKIERLHSSSPV